MPSQPRVIRIARRLSVLPLAAGIALAVGGIVPPATAKPDRVRSCGQISYLAHVNADVRVTVGRVRGMQVLDTPCGVARKVAQGCIDGRETKGWRCVEDPKPHVLFTLHGVGLPRGQARLVTVLL